MYIIYGGSRVVNEIIIVLQAQSTTFVTLQKYTAIVNATTNMKMTIVFNCIVLTTETYNFIVTLRFE